MPHWDYDPYPEGVTPEEFRKLLVIRRQTIEAAARADGSLFPMPVSWRRGWTAHLRIGERDRDDSLCAEVVVEIPERDRPYVRRVRLCKENRLPFDLGSA